MLETQWTLFAHFLLIKPVGGMASFPFRKARLYIPGPKAKRQEWYIQYWAWDVIDQKLKKFSDFQVNKIKGSDKQKKAWAKAYILNINKKLAEGYHFNPVKSNQIKSQKEFDERKKSLPISHVINKFLDSKVNSIDVKDINKKNRNHQTLTTHLKGFDAWLEQKGLCALGVMNISKENIAKFLEFLTKNRNLSLRSRDNYLGSIKVFLNYCISESIIEASPARNFKKQSKSIGKNIAFTKQQQKDLVDFTRNEFPQLFLLSSFMYYTLMRTDELSLLKVGMIQQKSEGYISVPKEITKTGFDRIVAIPKQLMTIINDFNLLAQPKNYFVFSKGFTPGKDYYPSKYFGSRYRENVLDKFSWATKTHTLYSWKHTGIVELKKSGIQDAYIMMQSGHKSITSYQVYLKSLGIQENPVIINSFPSPGV